MIRIIHEDGIRTDRVCRYIDECHVEIGTGLYHIHEVAQRLARNGASVIPLRSTLPDKCYNVLPLGDEIITVKKGEDGYYCKRNHARQPWLLCGGSGFLF